MLSVSGDEIDALFRVDRAGNRGWSAGLGFCTCAPAKTKAELRKEKGGAEKVYQQRR